MGAKNNDHFQNCDSRKEASRPVESPHVLTAVLDYLFSWWKGKYASCTRHIRATQAKFDFLRNIAPGANPTLSCMTGYEIDQGSSREEVVV